MAERRSAPRVQADGEVLFSLDSPDSPQLKGALVDVSASGFRAVHDHVALSAGTLVRFKHPSRGGMARVVWNRVLGDQVESGFVVLPEDALGDGSS